MPEHVITAYGMMPEEYRARWDLKANYPTVAPNYARKRQEFAKSIGLGRKPRAVEPEPTPRHFASRSHTTPRAQAEYGLRFTPEHPLGVRPAKQGGS